MEEDRPMPHCSNRLFEWTMAFAFVFLGLQLVIWPTALANSKFQFLLDVIKPEVLAVLSLIVGLLRLVALYRNGQWPTWGPHVRAFCALATALVLLQMDVSLYLVQSAAQAPPSPTLPIFSALVLAEFYSTYRAAADARYRPL
jgi:hypothetical protein